MTVSANDIKTKGVSLFAKLFEKAEEIVINVRGKDKYVVIDIERYKTLRALELDHAYNEVMEDVKTKRYTTDLDAHLNELADELRD